MTTTATQGHREGRGGEMSKQTETRSDERYILPDSIVYDMQPYTYGAILTDLQWIGEYHGRPVLRGTVQSGTETSRLFQYSATKDIAGRTIDIYGVKDWELKEGRIVRVAS